MSQHDPAEASRTARPEASVPSGFESSVPASEVAAARAAGPLPGWWGRLPDRTLWILLAIALLALLLAIGFAVWVNASGPLHPVPVASSPSA